MVSMMSDHTAWTILAVLLFVVSCPFVVILGPLQSPGKVARDAAMIAALTFAVIYFVDRLAGLV